MSLHRDLVSDACEILDEHQLPHSQIIAVDRDSILYVNQLGHARTCWLHRPEGGRLQVSMEEGFQAEAPEHWHE